jgi:hypothetical protein
MMPNLPDALNADAQAGTPRVPGMVHADGRLIRSCNIAKLDPAGLVTQGLLPAPHDCWSANGQEAAKVRYSGKTP